MKELDKATNWLLLIVIFITVGSIFTSVNSKLSYGLFEFFLSSIGAAVLYSNHRDWKKNTLFYVLSASIILFSLAHPIESILTAKKIDRKDFTEAPPVKPENKCIKYYDENNKQIRFNESARCESNYKVKIENYEVKLKSYDERKKEAAIHNDSLKENRFNLTFLEKITIAFYIVIAFVYPACLHAIIVQAVLSKEQIEKEEKERLEKETIKPIKALSKMKQGELVMLSGLTEAEKKEKLVEIGLSRQQISKLKKAMKSDIDETIQQSGGKIRKLNGNKVETIGVKNGLAS